MLPIMKKLRLWKLDNFPKANEQLMEKLEAEAMQSDSKVRAINNYTTMLKGKKLTRKKKEILLSMQSQD